MGTSVVRGDSLAPADPPLSLLLREADALEKEREAFGTRGGGGGEGGGGGRSARSHLSVLGGGLDRGPVDGRTSERARGRGAPQRAIWGRGRAHDGSIDARTHAMGQGGGRLVLSNNVGREREPREGDDGHARAQPPVVVVVVVAAGWMCKQARERGRKEAEAKKKESWW